jgi:hypothetical protein
MRERALKAKEDEREEEENAARRIRDGCARRRKVSLYGNDSENVRNQISDHAARA